MKKKNGFTLVEVLAVIAILGIIIAIASVSVTSILNREKGKLVDQMEADLKDAAVAYAISEKIILRNCPTNFNPENLTSANSSCYREVTVNDIIKSGIFTDDNNYCNRNTKVVVYKYKDSEFSEIRAYVKEGTCK